MAAFLSMQDIANVANVQRPVVSVWRRRYVSGENPFPPPISPDKLMFDADAVADWLRATGRGNNAAAADDVAMHSSLLTDAADDLDISSLLLLIGSRAAGDLGSLEPSEVYEVVDGIADDVLAPAKRVADAFADTRAVALVDRLAEAAFGPAPALARLARAGMAADRRWGAESMTDSGSALLTAMAAEMMRATRATIIPAGPGGMSLMAAGIAALSEHEFPECGRTDASVAHTWQLAQWRHLAAAGVPIRVVDRPDADALIIAQWASATDDDAIRFFDWVDDLALDLGPGGAALVVGPAALLVDNLPPKAAKRRSQLLGTVDYFAPLRYVARLPKGLLRTSGRRQLAVWVLAPATDEYNASTVYADHSAHALTYVESQAVAADVVAAATDEGARRAHTFLRGVSRASRVVVPRHQLLLPSTATTDESGGEILARLWDAIGKTETQALHDISLRANPVPDDSARPLSWRAATRGTDRLARVMSGVRLPHDAVGPIAPGSVVVISSAELRDPDLIGTRGVNRLELERLSPHATFTEPGDVIYQPTTPPRAMVDDAGGHLVLTPARVLRPLVSPLPRRIDSHIAAADIRTQHAANVDVWSLRTIAAAQASIVATVRARIAAHRAKLRAELAALDAAEVALAHGVTSGLLVGEFRGQVSPDTDGEN